MRKITDTHTGKIVTDTDLALEDWRIGHDYKRND